MLLLLASLAFAQDPQVFDPIPADVGDLSGILVDEETFTELGELRVAVATKDAELMSFEEWKGSHELLFTTTMEEMRVTHKEGQDTLVAHYESTLERERKKDFIQRHGFPLGVAAGLVAATVLYLGATHFYGEVLTVNL